jgi:hypothetical protein
MDPAVEREFARVAGGRQHVVALEFNRRSALLAAKPLILKLAVSKLIIKPA